ncbi:MAG: MASE1 domain-containing protein [Parachlamydiaceae bacterium]|nr:MASE1 domain-containing protein [Parachlamydiaceae bacterium]
MTMSTENNSNLNHSTILTSTHPIWLKYNLNDFLFLIALTIAFIAAAKLGLMLAIPPDIISPVWPPAGIALSAVLWRGYWVWPAIWLGTLFGSIPSYPVSAILGVGVVLQAFAGAYVLKKLTGSNNPFESSRNAIVFIIFSSLLSCLISPIIGITDLKLFSIFSVNYTYTLFTFWLGDSMGTLIFTPVIMAWYRKSLPKFNFLLWLELLLFIVFLQIVACLIYFKKYPVAYLLLPFPIWATMRFGQQLGMLSALLISGFTIYGAINNNTGLGETTLINPLFLVQSFMGVIFVPLLIISSLLQEKERAYEEVENRVIERTKDLNLALSELEFANRNIIHANNAKSEFLTNISHELRTPLNTIIGYSELLSEEIKEKRIVEFIPDLEKIKMSGKHLLSLINNVLDISKIEAGKMELFLSSVDLIELLNEIEIMATPLAVKKFNTFVLDSPPKTVEIYTDATKLIECLLNLIGNSCKFTMNGTVSLKVSYFLRDQTRWVKFEVIDTGVGIKKENLNKLFQMFSQINSTTSPEGTGLGLYLTKRFCTLMGGEITVSSNVNKGSTFTILLPQILKVKNKDLLSP